MWRHGVRVAAGMADLRASLWPLQAAEESGPVVEDIDEGSPMAEPVPSLSSDPQAPPVSKARVGPPAASGHLLASVTVGASLGRFATARWRGADNARLGRSSRIWTATGMARSTGEHAPSRSAASWLPPRFTDLSDARG